MVYGHHPIYSGGNYQDRPDLIASLLPILQNRADVYICGHDHNLQALRPEEGVRFYVAGGGGAGLYELRPTSDRSSPAAPTASRSSTADRSRLTISLVDMTGATLYEETVKKTDASQ